MSALTDGLMAQLSGAPMQQLSSQLGMNESQTQTAVQAALPMLMTALSRNASSGGGAQALAGALDRDHSGDILGNLAGFLGGGSGMSDGAAILSHVLGGGGRRNVESGVSQATGIDANTVAKLLPLLAPVIMGMLGKTKRQQGLDAGGLASMLGQERQTLQSRQPDAMSMVEKLLDADGDGDTDMSDIASRGLSMLSQFMK